MKFLHYELELDDDEAVEVELEHQANIRLLDEHNFAAYVDGRGHQFTGGLAVRTPITLHPPHAGHWHLVIDLGGHSGTLSAQVHVVPVAAAV